MTKIAPSILAADFSDIRAEVTKIQDADYIHVDIMDGMFVPNIAMGFPIVKALHRITDIPLDIHMMVERPLRYVEEFAEAGADMITIHLESDTSENTFLALQKIHENGKRAGIVLKPETQAEEILPYLNQIDMVLVMCMEPGIEGQPFMWEILEKIKKVRKYIDESGKKCELEVDGGINLKTAPAAKQAGANVLVAGSGIFGADDIPKRILELRTIE